MRMLIRQFVYVLVALMITNLGAFGQDTGANSSGNWNNASIWTGGTIPGSSNNVYIGSTNPAGAAATATVTLTQAQSANNVYVGNGTGTSGTLDLAGNTLTISTSLFIGYYGDTGTLNEGGGSFTATNAYVGNGNSLAFGTSDVVSSLQLSGGSTATTAASGNVTGNIDVDTGSTLNLGANLSLSGNLDVEDTGSIVNMNGNNISASAIFLGWYSNQAVTLDRGTTPGTLTATSLYVADNTFNLLATDSVSNFYLSNSTTTLGSGVSVSSVTLQSGSTGTTTATGNITTNATVNSGSTLNLGANLSLSGNLDLENTGSIVNMNGNNISANSIFLGWYSNEAVTLDRGTTSGSLTATNLYVAGNTFSLQGTDAVANLSLSHATVTTAATGNITASANIDSGSTLNLGANLSLSGNLDVEDTGSIVNMNGNNISASAIFLGWYSNQAVTLDRGTTPGTLTATSLYVADNTFNLLATDSVSNFYLSNSTTTLGSGVSVSSVTLQSGSTGTTTATGNITTNATVNSGSTLNFGANLSLSGNLDLENTGSIVNMNGNNISANSIFLGWYSNEAVTLDRGTTSGSLTATNLYVAGNTFSLLGADAVANLSLSHATVTTAATGNITASANIDSGSTLNLGANLSLSGSLDVENTGSTVNGHGFGITADSIFAGYYSHESVSLFNLGTVTTNDLYAGGGSTVTLHGGDTVNSLIALTEGSTLTVQQVNGMGLTLNGNSLSDLTIDPSSMDLIFNLNSSSNWDFRWADPSSGNWISTLDAMIADGQIVISSPNGYSVVDNGGYTYIMGGISSIPEPSSLVLACIATLGVAVAATWKGRGAGPLKSSA